MPDFNSNSSKSDKKPGASQVKIFDTTLRDGQQCPGAGMTFEQNLQYVDLACALKVDVIEAGFPAASSLDFAIVKAICERVNDLAEKPTIAALCQLREEQVVKTIEALQLLTACKKARLHVYVPVDPELMPVSLGEKSQNQAQIVRDVFNMVNMAASAGLEVQFSPEGYSRMQSNFDFVTELIRAAVGAGAGVINCPDTIGGACSLQNGDYFVEKMKEHAAIIKKEFPNRDVIWSVHCHNDFGLAVQNSINAVFKGPARQIEGCINGVGERAGNASLEQVIMVIKQFGATAADESFYTNVRTESIQAISDFVSQTMLPRQPHWPVTGDNAAKHSSGGHTNAILKNPLAYQPYDPSEIGKEITFLFGPLSGGNHAKAIIEKFGFVCRDSEKAEIAQYIKDHYKERRKGITDEELLSVYFEYRQPITVDRIDYTKSDHESTVTMYGDFFARKGEFKEANDGKDSALAAVKKACEAEIGAFQVLNHRSQSDATGFDARSISEIIIETARGKQFKGVGKDRDIELSAIRALIDAVNKAYIDRHFALVKPGESKGPVEETRKQPVPM